MADDHAELLAPARPYWFVRVVLALRREFKDRKRARIRAEIDAMNARYRARRSERP